MLDFIGPWRATLLSGLLIAACHPPFDVGPLILIAFVPWLASLPRFKTGRGAFFASFLAGMAVFLIDIFFLSQMESAPGTEIAMYGMWVTVSMCGAIYYGVFGALARWVMRRSPPGCWLAALPVLWVGLEFFRYWAPAPFPMLFPGYALHQLDALIQIADLGGIHLVTLFVLLVNACFVVAGQRPLQGSGIRSQGSEQERVVPHGVADGAWNGMNTRVRPWRRLALATAITACTLVLGYGIVRMVTLGGELREDGPVAGIIQPNIRQDMKNDPTPAYFNERWSVHEELSKQVSRDGAELIIWSETSHPWALPSDFGAMRLVQDPRLVARRLRTPMLIGATTLAGPEDEKTYDYLLPGEIEHSNFNTAWFIGPMGEVRGRFDKVHLVPGGEYIPFRQNAAGALIAEYAMKLMGHVPSVLPGRRFDTFVMEDRRGRQFRFTANICYEFAFPQLFLNLHGVDNVHFAVNISNEAWYFGSAELDDAIIMSRFRAIESRVSAVRATNTGISAIIDPLGRVRHTLKVDGKDRMVRGAMVEAVPYFERPPRTVFLSLGMWVGWLTGIPSLALLIAACCWPLIRRLKRAPAAA